VRGVKGADMDECQCAIHELGETLEVSTDPEIIAAVQEAQQQVDRGNIVWH
jgi:hypothetical protein